MRWAIILLLMASCLPKAPVDENIKIFVLSHEVSSKGMLIKIETSLPIATLRKQIYLVSSPNREVLDLKELNPKYLTMKKGASGQVDLLSKIATTENLGLYRRINEKAVLIYTLAVKSSVSVMHDLGPEPLTVSADRTIFRFKFSAAVDLHDDQAIEIKSLEGQNSPVIENLTLFKDQKTLLVRLKEALIPGQQYVFRFSPALMGALIPKELKFSIAKNSAESLGPAFYSISERSVEFNWPKPNPGFELFIFDDEKIHFYDYAEENKLYVSGLSSSKKYKFLLRTIDQNPYAAEGSFTTGPPEYLRILEIGLNKSQEYIKIINSSDQDLSLLGLSLSIEGTDRKDCSLGEDMLLGQGELWIASANFVAPANAHILRLLVPDACGELWGKGAKDIKIHRNDGGFIDRFSGHLWPKRREGVIKRIDLGLDEPSNYCYQKVKFKQ